MSPIALPLAELKPALTGLAKVINRDSALPILNTTHIERTADGWVALTATDLDTFVIVRLEKPTSGDPERRSSCPAKRLRIKVQASARQCGNASGGASPSNRPSRISKTTVA